MPQVIQKPITKVVTKDGECEITIVLELNINLNSDGMTATVKQPEGSVKTQSVQVEEDDKSWIIPNFQHNKINFGKKVE